MRMTPTYRLFQRLLTLLAAAALAGCAALPGQAQGPAKQTYLLQWPQGLQLHASAPERTCHTLLVTPPRAASGFGGTGMAYSQTPYHISYFAYNQWVDTPGRMLEPLLVRALDRSGLFTAVVPAPAPVDADLRLDTEVLQLLQAFQGQRSEVRFDLRVRLFDLKRGTVLADRLITTHERAEKETPGGGAAAANRALRPLLRAVVETVGAPLAAGRASCGG
jgi:cholesterol transport system auxiliary component